MAQVQEGIAPQPPGRMNGLCGIVHCTPQSHLLNRRGIALWLLATLTLLLAVPALPAAANAAVNRFEQEAIEAEAVEAFRAVHTLWREEVYFELYDTGTAASKGRISQTEFAQRMVESDWVPDGALNPRYLSATFRFRTMVYVTARLRFRNKFNPERTYEKDARLLLLKENGQWRVDLVQLIRAPFA